MNNKMLTVIYLALLISMFTPGPVLAEGPVAEEPSGAGTTESPYEIATLENLYWIAENSTSWDKHFIQTDNIDANDAGSWFEGAGWTPIGDDITRFTGSYDGQGYYIERLKINRPNTNNVGLFGHVGHDSAATTIKNLGLKDVSVKGARGTGSLIGRVTGNFNTTVENCYALGGEVTGDGATGGLVGSFNSYLENPAGADRFRPRMIRCFTDITVNFSGQGSGKDKFGGLAGCAQKGRVMNCYARGPVTASGSDVERVGGLLGCIVNRGLVEKSYSTGVVAAEGAIGGRVGGLVGYSSDGINESGEWDACFWDTDTSGQATSAAGTGKTTTAMKTQSTFTDADWDFVEIWAIDEAINDGYPYLQGSISSEAEKLFIRTQPVGGLSGKPLDPQPVIEIRDKDDELVSTDSTTGVTVTLLTGPEENLGGTATVTAVEGVVTFDDLILTGLAGEEHTLQFTAEGLDPVDSDPVMIRVRGWGALHVSGKIQPAVQPLSYETRTNTLTVRITLLPEPELEPIPEETKISVYLYNLDENTTLAGQVEVIAAGEVTVVKIPLSEGEPLRSRHAITAMVALPDS
jgi:hypothetical protein